MFKIPSLQSLAQGTTKTIKRFPFALLAAAVGSFTAIYFVSLSDSEMNAHEDLWRIVMCSNLAICLSIATTFFSESKNKSKTTSLGLQLPALGLVALYWYTSPSLKEFDVHDVIRFILFVMASHLLVSFAFFISSQQSNGFWQLNRYLFIRFLTSVLYSAVLFGGLSLAIAAIDNLFDIHIDGRRYAQLWLFIAGIFNTWFYLAGIPQNIQELDQDNSYPKGLKIFTQYVLLPLVTIYLAILYAYMIKIGIDWKMPRGWVSYLVIGFSTAGILSLLLIWPIRENEGNAWIKIYSKWFFRALFPLIGLLWLAIYKRVHQYGITENRYFVLLIAAWLGCMAIYFLLSKTKNIKIIPITLFLIAVLSSFGPWGAFSVSKTSQLNRLENILIQNKILVNGKIKKLEPVLKGDTATHINDIVQYIVETHGHQCLQPWFDQDLDSVINSNKESNRYIARSQKKGQILNLMGVEETYYYYNQEGYKQFYINEKTDQGFTAITGFDYISHAYINNYQESEEENAKIPFGKDSIYLYMKDKDLIIKYQEKSIASIDMEKYINELKPKAEKSYQNYMLPQGTLRYPIQSDSIGLCILFKNISGEINENEEFKINHIDAEILIDDKRVP